MIAAWAIGDGLAFLAAVHLSAIRCAQRGPTLVRHGAWLAKRSASRDRARKKARTTAPDRGSANFAERALVAAAFTVIETPKLSVAGIHAVLTHTLRVFGAHLTVAKAAGKATTAKAFAAVRLVAVHLAGFADRVGERALDSVA